MPFVLRAFVFGAVLTALAICGPAAIAQQGLTDTEILVGKIASLTGVSSVGSLGLRAGNKMAIAEGNSPDNRFSRQTSMLMKPDPISLALRPLQ